MLGIAALGFGIARGMRRKSEDIARSNRSGPGEDTFFGS
jgi:hypothetical protein